MKVKKAFFNRIVEVVLTIALTSSLLFCATNVCERKVSKYRFGSFFDNKEEYDVMFYGSSHMINAVFPNYLWRDYGISAYNFGAHADYIPSTYWVMRNTFDYVNPKLVVVDCYTISESFKICSYEFWHDWIDAFPMSTNKINAIVDLGNDELKKQYINEGVLDADSMPDTAEMYWDFCKYHSRWNDLNDEDFNTPKSTEKGAEARVNVYPATHKKMIGKDQIYEEDGIGIVYLKKIIEYCQERGIDVLLTYIPFPAESDRQMQANRAGCIASEYNVNYINFLDEDIVDYNTDFYDDTHLNSKGAQKVTDYIGRYIAENYDIPDRHDDVNYEVANEDYSRFVEYKLDAFEREDNLTNSLVLMDDKDFDKVIIINDEKIWDEEVCEKLLNSIQLKSDMLVGGKGCVLYAQGTDEPVVCDELPEEYKIELEGCDSAAMITLILKNNNTESMRIKTY